MSLIFDRKIDAEQQVFAVTELSPLSILLLLGKVKWSTSKQGWDFMTQHTASSFIEYLESQALACERVFLGHRHITEPCSLNKTAENGFCFFGKKRWSGVAISLEGISLLLISNTLEEEIFAQLLEQAHSNGTTLVQTSNPRLAFMTLIRGFYVQAPPAGLHPDASVDPSCTIDPSASICAGVRLGPNVEIGARTIVRENAVILAEATIGQDCYVGPGTSMGQPGFGYERDEAGAMVHFPHIGSIQIGNRVEIGSNTCIDRGTLDDTIIHDGVKIDNLCHISHNVVLYEDAVVIANSMIGGSVAIGPRAWLAPSCSVINGVTIGADTMVGMGSSVTKPVPDNTTVLGVPAVEISDFMFRKKKLTSMLDAFEKEN